MRSCRVSIVARFASRWATPNRRADPNIATCKTRAVRDGDEWDINGQKMFTSGAHNCQYIFLLTNTDPNGRRHRDLTMFLVPTDSPGLEIHGIRTVDGERTNITYYTDVRIPDRYRLGEVNDGWAVLNGPLTAEHGAGEADPVGLADIATMGSFGVIMGRAADDVAAVAAVADGSVAFRLGRAHARIEAAIGTPGIYGRVALAQTMRDVAPELMDVLGVFLGAAIRCGRGRASIPLGAACGYLRRHHRRVQEHDRAVHAWLGQTELLCAEVNDSLLHRSSRS
jgi:3-oxocholest-4-en-26-oyl-CoA dehydrogenase alpha subunit